MKELNHSEIKQVNGGFLVAAAAVIGAHYGYKFGRWLGQQFAG